ncbi:MAG: DAK2 domain-containing protein [Eubacteriales bacterium]|nr:DAK2 domain-containing protein [Eubacteriales bacterium]
MISALILKEAFIYGAYNLKKNEKYINELNVFPVPDGDTGSNMSMTIMQAVTVVESLQDISVNSIAQAIQSGSLRGARGNSGVILSQLLRGFTNVIKNCDNITKENFCDGIISACDYAYRAVMKPKEGTILTVAKALSDKATEYRNRNISIEELLSEIVKYGDEVLLKTPDMLAILKEANVVDSGGQGLMEFMRGLLMYAKGEKIDAQINNDVQKKAEVVDIELYSKSNLKFEYCTECIINSKNKFNGNEEKKLKEYLDEIGDSIVVVSDDNCMKVHVHTNHPGKIFEKGLEFGFLSNLKVDNLKLEHNEILIKDASKIANAKKQKIENFGFVVVSSGEGITNIFKDLGAKIIIDGGQTMNPSTDDFLQAINNVNAKNIYILPNNKNVILAAKQAKDLINDKKVYVVESQNIIQGLQAMIYFTENNDPEIMYNNLIKNMNSVQSIETTYAIRDTIIDGISIKEKDYISIGDKGLLSADKDIYTSIKKAIEKTITKESEILSLYYGEDVKENEYSTLFEKLNNDFPDLEIEMHEGLQPVYYYYISIE